MHRRILALVAVPLAFALPIAAPAAGQEGVAPQGLTIEEALAIARESHPAFDVYRATLEAADAEERGTAWWLRLLPTVSFGASADITQSRVLTGTDEFGRPVRLDDPISYRRNDYRFGPSFGQVTLFDGGVGLRQARSTRAGIRGTRARVEADGVRLETQLVRRYFDVVLAERQISVEVRRLESARINYEVAGRLLTVGTQDPLDHLNAEIAVAEAEQNLERARGETRKARLALKDAMGVPQAVDVPLADQLPEVFDPADLDVADLVATALAGNPVIEQVREASEQSRYALLSARTNRWPTVSAFLLTRSGTALGSGADPLFYLNPLNQTYTLGMSVRLNLFDRFDTSGRIAQATASYAAATESVRAIQLQTENAVLAAFIDLENVYRSIVLLDSRAELSRQRLELSQEKYRLSGLSFRDLQASLDAAYQAEQEALSARFAFASALLDLEEAAGLQIR